MQWALCIYESVWISEWYNYNFYRYSRWCFTYDWILWSMILYIWCLKYLLLSGDSYLRRSSADWCSSSPVWAIVLSLSLSNSQCTDDMTDILLKGCKISSQLSIWANLFQTNDFVSTCDKLNFQTFVKKLPYLVQNVSTAKAFKIKCTHVFGRKKQSLLFPAQKKKKEKKKWVHLILWVLGLNESLDNYFFELNKAFNNWTLVFYTFFSIYYNCGQIQDVVIKWECVFHTVVCCSSKRNQICISFCFYSFFLQILSKTEMRLLPTKLVFLFN